MIIRLCHNRHIDERYTPCSTNKPKSILFRDKEDNQKYRRSTLAPLFHDPATPIFSGKDAHIR